MNYVKRVLIAIDQLAGTVLLGTLPDETISAAVHRRGWKTAERLINAIFFDPSHCKDSYRSEFERHQLPADYSKE